MEIHGTMRQKWWSFHSFGGFFDPFFPLLGERHGMEHSMLGLCAEDCLGHLAASRGKAMQTVLETCGRAGACHRSLVARNLPHIWIDTNCTA